MDNKIKDEYFRSKGLLPHQADFALDFIENTKKPYREYIAPTGTDKMLLAANLIVYMLQTGSKKRILVLSPKQLLNQWYSVLSSLLLESKVAVAPVILDQNKYLELEINRIESQELWPVSGVIIMSLDLAKREDILEGISTVTWDFIVIDESHLLKGKRVDLLFHLINRKVARRALFLSATSDLPPVVVPLFKAEQPVF